MKLAAGLYAQDDLKLGVQSHCEESRRGSQNGAVSSAQRRHSLLRRGADALVRRRRIFALSALAVVMVATLATTSLPVYGQNPTFTTPVNLSNTPTGGCQQQASCQQTAASGNYVYAVWDDDALGRPNVSFKSSSNNGTVFGSATQLSSGTGWAQSPQVAASGNYVYVVWQDNSTGNFKLYLRTSSNNGGSFNAQANLGTTAHVDTLGVLVVASANNVYVAWLENANPPVVSFRASSDHGSSFAARQTMSGSTGNSFPPQLSAYGANVYVVWRQNVATGNDDVFFTASTNNGTTFSGSPTNLSSNTGESFDPAISSYGNNVYVAWPDNTGLSASNYDIFFTVSTNKGGVFAPVSNLSNNAGASIQPLTTASGNNVYVIWQDATPGNPDILFRGSSDNATSFGSTLNLSNNPGTSRDPRAAAIGNNLYVVWDDSTSGGIDDIFFTSSDNNGLNFGSVLDLSNNSGFSTKPQVAAFGSNVYVVWADDTSSPGFDDVYFTVGTPTIIIPPTCYSSGWAVPKNTPVTITLTGSDPLGLPLTFSITAGPVHGTLSSITSTGSTSAKVTYTPNSSYSGSDSFTFKANNGRIDSAPATMAITVAVPSGGARFVT